jgi:hypothetical protein
MSRPPRQKSTYKAIINGYDYVFDPAASQDEKRYCLTDAQVKALLPHIEPLGWKTRWYSLSNQAINGDVLEAFRDDIRKRLLMPCTGGGNGIDKNTNVVVAIDLEDKDDGTIISYAPSAPVDTFNHNTGETDELVAQKRMSSLCRAVESYVDTIIVQMVNDANASLIILGVIDAIIVAFNPMVGLFLAGITAAAAQLINDLGADEQAINDVKCCLLDGLKNKANTFDNFKIAMADCGFTDLSNQAQLAKRIDDANHFEANYRAFNLFLGQSFGIANPDDCPFCDGWCLLLDFTSSDYADIVHIDLDHSTAGAAYVAGVGYMPPSGTGAQIRLVANIPSYAQTTVAALTATAGGGTAALLHGTSRTGEEFSTWQSPAPYLALNFGTADLSIFYGEILERGWQKMFLMGDGVMPFNYPDNCTGVPW